MNIKNLNPKQFKQSSGLVNTTVVSLDILMFFKKFVALLSYDLSSHNFLVHVLCFIVPQFLSLYMYSKIC